jgi:predicted nucleotidyltransferase
MKFCIFCLARFNSSYFATLAFTATDRIQLAVFFGSYATGEARPSSDVDVAVYADSHHFSGDATFQLN